jgi:transposase
MPRSKELSKEVKGQIVGMASLGKSARQIGRELGISDTTISYVLRRFRMTGSNENAPRSGRPPILINLDETHLATIVKRNQFIYICIIQKTECANPFPHHCTSYHSQAHFLYANMLGNENNTPRRELTNNQRSKVIGAYQCGVKGSAIIEKFGLASRTVYNTIERYNKAGSPHTQHRPGRPKMLSERGERSLVRIANSDRNATLTDIAEKLGVALNKPISTRTTRKYLNKLGWKSYFKCKKPLLTNEHAKARLAWCHERRRWSNLEWQRVIFTDESKFNLNRPDGGERVWRRAHEKYQNSCTTPTVRFGGGGVMFWGCFSWRGVGPLVRIDGTMDSDVYIV